MKQKLFKLTLFCMSLLFLASCSKDDKPVVPVITVSETGLETVLLSDATSGTISFESNVVWKATSNQSWLTIKSNPKGVSGVITLDFSLEPNEEYDDRTAKITVVAGDETTDGTVTKEFTIIQKQKNALTITKSNFENLDYAGETIEIEVLHNIQFTTKINGDWITETKGLASTKLHFIIGANPTISPRTGSIEIISGNIKEVIQISQVGALVDNFKTTSVEVSYMAQFYGVYPELSIWNIAIYNEDAAKQNYDGVQQSIFLTISAPASQKFKNGIPEGEFTLDPQNFDSKPYTCSDAQLYTQEKGNSYYNDLTGKLVIKKIGDSYRFTTTVLKDGKESVTSVVVVKQGTNLSYLDGSCFSQLTSDVKITGTTASFVKLSKPYMANSKGGDVWKLVITGNNAQYKAAEDTFYGTGDILQATIFTAEKGGIPVGDFNIDWISRNTQFPIVTSYCNTGAGVSDPHFDGTGYMNYSIKDSKLVINKYAPPKSDKAGTVKIAKSGDTYTISIQLYDDSIDEPHKVEGSFSGSVSVYDQTAIAFKNVQAIYYGDKENNNTSFWNLHLESGTYKDDNSADGYKMDLKFLTSRDKIYKTGFPVGKFNFNAAKNAGNFIIGKIVTVKSGSAKVTDVTSGSFEVIKSGSSYQVKLSLKDNANNSYESTYTGSITLFDLNLNNSVFSNDGAKATFTKDNVVGSMNNWYFLIEDGNFNEANSTGIRVSLDLLQPTSAGNNVPTGTFNLVKSKTETGIYAGQYTYFTAPNSDKNVMTYFGDTGSSVKIESGANGTYKVTFNLVDEYGYKLTGVYDGKPTVK